jgi:hypothetical protein
VDSTHPDTQGFAGDADFGQANLNGEFRFEGATRKGLAFNPAERDVPNDGETSDPG